MMENQESNYNFFQDNFPIHHYIESKTYEELYDFVGHIIYIDESLGENYLNEFVNSEDPYGRTPLYLAVLKQDIKLCQLLLNCGSNPDFRSKKLGLTPLELAKQKISTNCVLIYNALKTHSKENSSTGIQLTK